MSLSRKTYDGPILGPVVEDEVTPLLGMTRGNQHALCTRGRHSLEGRVNETKTKISSIRESLGTGPGNTAFPPQYRAFQQQLRL